MSSLRPVPATLKTAPAKVSAFAGAFVGSLLLVLTSRNIAGASSRNRHSDEGWKYFLNPIFTSAA
tara:strand:- start:3865 stop:4059 length:195 start_codon:yes stop_codon:yes gene_type:complete